METVLPREVRKLASTIEEKDVVIALMNDDLQERHNQIQAIKYENVALQAQRLVYQAELQSCQDTITHLRTRYVDHARGLGKGNIIIIVRKHTTPANDKFHDLSYYIARIQQRKRYVKLRWLLTNQTVFTRLIDLKRKGMQSENTTTLGLTREELCAMEVPAILDDE